MNDKIDINKIKKLQNTYLKFCENNLLNDKTIHAGCLDAEKEINDNYDDLYENTKRRNLISTPFERLVTFHVIKFFFQEKINIKLVPSIISSDLIFELDDCFINIDCKTVNMVTNPGDANDISVSPNQMTFSCPPLYKKHFQDGRNFSGFHYEGHQKPIKNGKPNFTYMFKLVYADNYSKKDIQLDGSNSETKKEQSMVNSIKLSCKTLDIKNISSFKSRTFKNLSLALACVPNGLTVDNEIKNKILQGFKTYKYITSEINYSSKYKPLKNIKSDWKKIELKEIIKGKRLKFWLDENLKHPNYENEFAVWGERDKKFCVMTGGDAARLNRDLVNCKKFLF